jgi:hypothetical protein
MSNVVALQDARPWNYTLADAAADIKRRFEELDEHHRRFVGAHNKAMQAKFEVLRLRFALGDALLDAQRTLKEQDPRASFEAWCEANVQRSMRDCYKCMRHANRINSGEIPGLKDAIKAGVLPQEWSAVELGQSRSADPAIIQDQQTKSVQIAIGLYRKMTVEEREQVKQAQKEIDHAE